MAIRQEIFSDTLLGALWHDVYCTWVHGDGASTRQK